MSKPFTTPSGAIVEEVPFEDVVPLTAAEAVEGVVATMTYDSTGKLYKIDGKRNATQVNVVREDGKKFYMNIADLMKSDRPFPVLPDYLPRVGDLVTVRGVRGVKPTDVLFVGAVTRGKAKCHLLDNTHRSVSLPIGNLAEVTASVTVTVDTEEA